MLDFKNANCDETVGCAELNLVMSLCKLLDIFLSKDHGVNPADDEHFGDITKMWFLFWYIHNEIKLLLIAKQTLFVA